MDEKSHKIATEIGETGWTKSIRKSFNNFMYSQDLLSNGAKRKHGCELLWILDNERQKCERFQKIRMEILGFPKTAIEFEEYCRSMTLFAWIVLQKNRRIEIAILENKSSTMSSKRFQKTFKQSGNVTRGKSARMKERLNPPRNCRGPIVLSFWLTGSEFL